MVRFRWISSLVSGAIVIACGGSSTGTGGGRTTITGTVGGAAVPTADTIAIVGPLSYTFGAYTTDGVVVWVSNLGDLCSSNSRRSTSNMTRLLIFVSSPHTIDPGSYAISTAGSATANFSALLYETFSAECSRTSNHAALSGLVTLSSIGATTVEGTFNVTMDTGDHLSGTFTAPVCNKINASDAGPVSDAGAATDAGTSMTCGM